MHEKLSNSIPDTPTHRLTIEELTNEQLEAHLIGIRERRLRAYQEYEHAMKLRERVKQDRAREKLDRKLAQLARTLEQLDKKLAAVEKIVIETQALRIEAGVWHVEATDGAGNPRDATGESGPEGIVRSGSTGGTTVSAAAELDDDGTDSGSGDHAASDATGSDRQGEGSP